MLRWVHVTSITRHRCISLLPRGTKTVVKLLVKHGADVKTSDNTNSTPLHLALRDGNSEVVNLPMTVAQMVDIREQQSRDTTAISLLSRGSAIFVLLLLLMKHRADVNARDKKEMTPLHEASRYGGLRCREARSCSTMGQSQNAQNDEVPDTFTHRVSKRGRRFSCKCLLTAGGQCECSGPRWQNSDGCGIE